MITICPSIRVAVYGFMSFFIIKNKINKIATIEDKIEENIVETLLENVVGAFKF